MDNNTQPQPQPQPVGPAPITPGAPQKSNNTAIIVIIVVLVVVVLPVIAVIVFVGAIFSSVSSVIEENTTGRLECTFAAGYLNINYNENEILGYSSKGMTFNLDSARSEANKVGINAYIRSEADEIESSYLGKCKINGVDYDDDDDTSLTPSTPSTPSTTPSAPAGVSTQTVGDSTYGYIDIPSTWNKFFDPDAPSTLQYASGFSNIVTMMTYTNVDATASNVNSMASNLYANLGTESGVTSRLNSYAIVGKDRISANYIKAVYNDGAELHIYLFKATDGYIHYLALAGTSEQLSEQQWIIDSFRTTK